jgi:hypothetical protein
LVIDPSGRKYVCRLADHPQLLRVEFDAEPRPVDRIQSVRRDQAHARQISRRGGELFCEHRAERVTIAGRAVLYLEGSIRVD